MWDSLRDIEEHGERLTSVSTFSTWIQLNIRWWRAHSFRYSLKVTCKCVIWVVVGANLGRKVKFENYVVIPSHTGISEGTQLTELLRLEIAREGKALRQIRAAFRKT